MNNARRKSLNEIIDALQDIRERLEGLSGEEQESLDNLPEGIQESERGQAMQEAADGLFEIADTIADACEQLSEIVTK